MWKSVCLILVSLCMTEVLGFQSRRATLDGYAVYRVMVRNVRQAKILFHLKDSRGILFWSDIDVPKHRADVMVSPDRQRAFLQFLNRHNMEWITIIDDVGAISELLDNLPSKRSSTDMDGDIGMWNVTRYMSYKQIKSHAESLTKVANPNNGEKLAELEVAGKSFNGQDVIMLKISSDHQKQKPIVFLEAAMHAREWAGPPTVLYLADQLVRNFKKNKDMLLNVDFYIIPVTNPDGYDYSREHDRMWRKTMSYGEHCIGVDGNRNFDYYWGVSGASSDPCSNTYKGPAPFSELESQNIRNVGLKYQNRLLGYVAVHSYGGYLLYPWGYSKDLPDDWERLDQCAASFTSAIAKFSGTKYIHGSSARVLYEAAGGSDDYMKGKLNIPFAYTLEIASSEEEGFEVNPKKLPAIGQETFEGFRALADCFWFFHSYDKASEILRRKSGRYLG